MITLTTLDYAREAAERSRRIETRLTKYLASIGFETGSRTPLWYDDGVVSIPSRATSLVDILSVVPDSWDRNYEITVVHKSDVIGCVLKP